MGNKNTKFFHTTTLIRPQRNKIEGLVRNDASYTWERNEMKQMAVSCFTTVFRQKKVPSSPLLNHVISLFCDKYVSKIGTRFTTIEFRKAIFDMSPYKAPKPDNFQLVFYQKMWNVVGWMFLR